MYDPNSKARIACAVIEHAQQVAPEAKTITITVDLANELRRSFERTDTENQDAREALRLIQWYLAGEDAPQPSMLHDRPKDLAHGVACLADKMWQIEKMNRINKERS